MSKLGRWADEQLYDIGLTRKDLRLHFRWKGKRYYIPTFNPLWWLCMVTYASLMAGSMYAFVVLIILLAP